MPKFYTPQQPQHNTKINHTPSSSPLPTSPSSHKTVSDCTIYHQKSKLEFIHTPNHDWYYQGRTIIYLTTSTPPSFRVGVGESNTITDEIALHFRGGNEMKILSTQVYVPRHANINNDVKDTLQSNESTNIIKPTKRRRTLTLPTRKNNKEKDDVENKQDETMMDVEMPPALHDDVDTAEMNSNNIKGPAIKLQRIPNANVHHSHVDPLSKVLTKPHQTFTDMEYCIPESNSKQEEQARQAKDSSPSTQKTKRFEADTQCSRNGIGMTEALRSKSIASNCGELRIQYQIPPSSVPLASSSSSTDDIKEDMVNCWKTELQNDPFEIYDSIEGNSTNNRSTEDITKSSPQLSTSLKRKSMLQCDKRRDDRLDYISNCLANASDPFLGSRQQGTNNRRTAANDSKKKEGSDKSREAGHMYAIKLLIHYRLDVPMEMSTSFHLGGIHFHSSSLPLSKKNDAVTVYSNPHVYTTSGIIGDHQGPRCWIPTFDTAKAIHRCSQEMYIQVTSHWKDGSYDLVFVHCSILIMDLYVDNCFCSIFTLSIPFSKRSMGIWMWRNFWRSRNGITPYSRIRSQ